MREKEINIFIDKCKEIRPHQVLDSHGIVSESLCILQWEKSNHDQVMQLLNEKEMKNEQK